MKKLYLVEYLPNDKKIKNKAFVTEQEAEDYVKSFLCHSCLSDLERGYIDLKAETKNEIDDRINIKYPSQTLCGADFYLTEVII